MTALMERVAPHATDLVRKDHRWVLECLGRYHAADAPGVRRGLAQTIGLALEVHTQLEDELLYPAVREVASADFLRRATQEHEHMRAQIARLRSLDPADPTFDATFFGLMRDVMHHMADEETVFLPEAERVLRGRLGELGAHMVRRRLALMAPRTPALAWHRARARPARSLALVAGLALAGVWLGRALARPETQA